MECPRGRSLLVRSEVRGEWWGEEGSVMDNFREQAEFKPAGGALVIDGVDTTEDDLLVMITSLEERLGDVRELHQERQDIEDELEDLRGELEAREAEIDQREQLLSESSSELHTERARLQEERDAILAQQRALEAKHAELEAKEAGASERVVVVDEMQARLEAAESALRAERERRAAEAEQLRREQEELAERERELAAHAAEEGKASPEIAELAAQLADAQQLANERAAVAEKRAAEAQEHTVKLETRCRELAEQCDVVRRELKGTREQARRVEQELPQRIVQEQLRINRAELARRSVGIGLTWLCAVVTSGAAVVAGINSDPAQAALMLGMTFAAFFFGAHALAGRLFDAPAIVIGLIGVSFGWWFPMWSLAVAQALQTWSLPLDSLPSAIVAELPQAVSVATALLTLTVGIFALTWSGTLLFQIGSVSVFAGGLALFPDESGFALAAAAVIWLVVTGTGLTRWASRVAGTVGPTATPGRLAAAGAQSGGRVL